MNVMKIEKTKSKVKVERQIEEVIQADLQQSICKIMLHTKEKEITVMKPTTDNQN